MNGRVLSGGDWQFYCSTHILWTLDSGRRPPPTEAVAVASLIRLCKLVCIESGRKQIQLLVKEPENSFCISTRGQEAFKGREIDKRKNIRFQQASKPVRRSLVSRRQEGEDADAEAEEHKRCFLFIFLHQK